jgi:hypothetical protein
VKRGRLMQARAIVALQEHPMKTNLTICNEADYLQAHLTFIVSRPRPGNPVFQDFKERATSLLKKWITAASAEVTSRQIHQRGFRVTGKAQRFEALR